MIDKGESKKIGKFKKAILNNNVLEIEGHIRLNKNEIDFLKSFKNNKTH